MSREQKVLEATTRDLQGLGGPEVLFPHPSPFPL